MTRITDSPVLLTLAMCAVAGVRPAPAQTTPPEAARCEEAAAYGWLDFWLGEWDVFTDDGVKVGTNLIEKILDGCAVLEHWRDARGREGRSLFFYKPERQEWKQVWVTDTGAWKEKVLVESGPDRLRFQGELPASDGSAVLDRTTLARLDEGRVRQTIEQSRDGGATWRPAFQATYVRRAAP